MPTNTWAIRVQKKKKPSRSRRSRMIKTIKNVTTAGMPFETALIKTLHLHQYICLSKQQNDPSLTLDTIWNVQVVIHFLLDLFSFDLFLLDLFSFKLPTNCLRNDTSHSYSWSSHIEQEQNVRQMSSDYDTQSLTTTAMIQPRPFTSKQKVMHRFHLET